MAKDTAEHAIKAADQKTQRCEMERVAVEVALRNGFDAARPDAKEDFFRAAIANMNLGLQDASKLTYNYEAADKVAPPLNIPARIERVSTFVKDKCMGK